ncbi:MAG: hypothetical protein DRJ03_27715 [Chloroflexi bacterium]|nr:MAG: hypothetical protein DRI81_19510 [Chloroflexota bacterium]RLC76934.1 MAG: hypothetical protein DRJ03_27715 [Chloroflexota bacterium]
MECIADGRPVGRVFAAQPPHGDAAQAILLRQPQPRSKKYVAQFLAASSAGLWPKMSKSW